MRNMWLNDERLRPVKFFVFSLGCHLIVIQVFSISFTAQPAMPKPNFIFLGSILDSQDISRYVAQAPSNSDAVQSSDVDFFGRHKYEYQTRKPTVQNVKGRNKQTDMRTVFEIEPLAEEDGPATDAAGEEFEFRIPAYNPLRLR